MHLDDFDYDLPPERIAQHPLPQRDASRMLWLHRGSGTLDDRHFRELPEILLPGDLLVANDSRVFPARLRGRRASGAAVEFLLLREHVPDSGDATREAPRLSTSGEWNTLARPGRKLPVGERIVFAEGFEADIVARGPQGERRLRFHFQGDFTAWLNRLGHVPLPPYIRHGEDEPADRERYQTVYARDTGSAAAPTAGLHFTPAILDRFAARGIEWTTVSLHVGLGTFQPVTSSEIESHRMHTERFAVSAAAAAALNRARRDRRRIIAVGTTAARVLETAAPASGREFEPLAGETRLYIYPGGRGFQVLDGMLTNFHAPRTTLLMMIAALAGLDPIRRAYTHALAAGYRFLSYGDCMLIL